MRRYTFTLRDGKLRWLRLTPDAPRAGKADLDWADDAPARLEGVAAQVAALDVDIRSGDVATRPRDAERCGRGRCSFADLCRYEGGS